MPMKKFKDGNRCSIVEFDVREINDDGECIDVNSFDTLDEASRYAAALDTYVIERHTARRPAHRFANPDVYQLVTVGGNRAALRRGGWIDE